MSESARLHQKPQASEPRGKLSESPRRRALIPFAYVSAARSPSLCLSLSVSLKSRLPAPSRTGNTSRW